MDIILLPGEDQRLYSLVAHLTMNEDVLKYNLNYPYKTSSEYSWLVATDNGNTLGFLPVKLEEKVAKINNYYVADDDKAVFSALLKEAIRTFSVDYDLEAIVQIQHIPDFEKSDFWVALYWKRYAKMKAFRHEKDCL